MCADRVPPTPTLGGDPVAPDDLTLSGADDAGLQAAGFPDTVQDAHLVLYPSTGGGVELRWHLDATALAHARGAFGDDHDAPSPVLRLRQLGGEEGGGGASRVIADAPLEDRHMVADGLARCSAGAATGLLQAEIGLSTAAGGWVLVARSNRLQAIGPVGAPFLRAAGPPAVAAAAELAPSTEPEPRPAPIVPPSAMPQPLKPLGRLIPDFPLVQPPPSAALEAGSAMSLDSVAAAAHDDGAGHISPSASGRFDRSLVPLGPLISEAASALVPALGSALAEISLGESDLSAAATPSSVPDQPSGDAHTAPSGALPADSLPVPGSGPLRRFSVGTASEISAELLVHGSAAPGMLLDLGGHPYRVGAGGRFAFRIPLHDWELIMRLLASVPSLPVESRVGDGEPGEQGD